MNPERVEGTPTKNPEGVEPLLIILSSFLGFILFYINKTQLL